MKQEMIVCLKGSKWGDQGVTDSKTRRCVNAQNDMGMKGWGRYQKHEII